jgi:hypothetical protein
MIISRFVEVGITIVSRDRENACSSGRRPGKEKKE